MTDPYQVLGVSPSATDEEIKTAYHNLAKKYHPDNYAGSPIADLASEKMKEINEAYDAIQAQRKNRGSGQQTGGYGGTYGYGGAYGCGGAQNSSFGDVRSYIMSGRISDAEQILDGVPGENRNAEWYFLKGTVLYKRGWLDEATNHFNRAVQMDPQNMEYRTAMNQIMNQRSGMYGGYNPNMTTGGGFTGCGACGDLMAADMCCECMGGNLCPCIGFR